MNAPAPKVLLIEDEQPIRRFVRVAVEEEGCQVIEAETVARGLIEAGSRKPDLLILDLGLPDGNGIDLIRDLRGWSDVPVLILSARSQENDKIDALDAGADDYLTKPFDLGELQARLRALIRRAAGAATPTLEHAGVRLDPASKRVTRDGQPVTLSAREYALLRDLLTHKSQLRTRAQLEDSLYAWGAEVESNTVEVYIHHLRKKLGSEFIRTVRGFGYQLGEKAGRETDDGEAPG